MEVNWCKREDTEEKEATEIVTTAWNASMDIYRGCKTATGLAEPPALLVQCHLETCSCGYRLFLSLCLSPPDRSRELPSLLTPLPWGRKSWS